MANRPNPRPVVLCILDGWGERRSRADNAIRDAEAPNWHRFLAHCPHATLEASEHFVGLPEGQMGNSEVGHTNIGAGRVVLQDLPRIDRAVKDGSLGEKPGASPLHRRLEEKRRHRASDGPASRRAASIRTRATSRRWRRFSPRAGIQVAVHAFLDGRDTPPKSAARYLGKFAARHRRTEARGAWPR